MRNVWLHIKPAFLTMIIAAVSYTMIGVCSITNILDKLYYYPRIGDLTVTERFSNMEGMTMSIIGFDLSSDPQNITVEWDNCTSQDFMFRCAFWIYRLVDEEWIPCGSGGNVSHDLGFKVTAQSARHHTFPISQNCDLAVPGTYRIQMIAFNYCKGWVEFSISD